MSRSPLEIIDSLQEKYEPVIGLEVHVQLLTRTKAFCGCPTRFGAPPNTNVCPVCLGMPGALPVLNREAVAMAIKAALALNCRIMRFSRFSRKNYFYPDLPKGYQISQYDQPISENGWILIHPPGGVEKKISITRLHLEEDAGKSIHDGFPDSQDKSYVDLNRSGVPLVEIVSEPDLGSPEEAYDYVTRLKQILLYLGVSDCNMEEGSLRCDANVSVRPRGQRELGVKAEVKNLNSFRFLQRALEYEIARQAQVLDGGGIVTQETRLWNTQLQRTVSMRSKEDAHDYRYFPEPDLLPLVVSEAWEEEIYRTLPELPEDRRNRLMKDYGLRDYDAEVLTATRELADYYEEAVKELKKPELPVNELLQEIDSWKDQVQSGNNLVPAERLAANWVMGELLGALKVAGKEISESPVSPKGLAKLLELITNGAVFQIVNDIDRLMTKQGKFVSPTPADTPAVVSRSQLQDYGNRRQKIQELGHRLDEIGTISGKIAKTVFETMLTASKSADEVVKELGVRQISDDGAIREAVRKAIASNPKQLGQYKSGKTTLFGFFVGQVMKATAGQANPQMVNDLLKEELERS